LWRRLFGCATVADTNVTHDDVNLRGALLPAIAAVATRRGDDGFTRTAVALGPQVSHIGAMAMLHFAYSGELPKLSLRDLQEARKQALLFDLAEMENWCVTVEIVRDLWLGSVDDSRWSEAENRKPALTTISARHRKDGAVLFNSATLADVAFVVESDGEIVYGHRALLHAHSPVMASQFGGRFADGRADDGALPMVRAHIGGVASETVLGLLHYVCCGDQAAIGERDVIDLMQLANRYDMAGLRKLCEKSLIKELDRNVWERVLRADVDSIGLLVIAEEQRATQLTQYLTRFIGAHQHVIRKHQPESWTQLETTMPAHLEAINEHKWPPQRYFEMLEAFELRDSAANASTSWVRRIWS
jgi:hypothetical protein